MSLADDARINAEAAAWLARIQGAHEPALEEGLRDWLRADLRHQDAFERATELWDILPGTVSVGTADLSRDMRPRFSPVTLAASLLLAIGIGGGYAWMRQPPSFVTKPGQQQVTSLSDGSTVALNTDSKLTVIYSAQERRVRLDRGEAMFDVTHNAARPFIVVAGRDEVRALGTSFVVRRDGDRLAVTLLRGKVAISEQHGSQTLPVAVLAPGQRARLVLAATPIIDRPALDAVTAWRRGEIVFDNDRLGDAINELNRYGGVHIRIEDPVVADMRVSGVFETNDAAEFAAAISELDRLRATRDSDDLVLSRK